MHHGHAAIRAYPPTTTDITTAEAKELARSCTLNLSSCTLNLQDYAACITHCNTVLSEEPANVKALYRRGQAYLHTQRLSAAVQDLQQAMDGSPADQKEVGGGCCVGVHGALCVACVVGDVQRCGVNTGCVANCTTDHSSPHR